MLHSALFSAVSAAYTSTTKMPKLLCCTPAFLSAFRNFCPSALKLLFASSLLFCFLLLLRFVLSAFGLYTPPHVFCLFAACRMILFDSSFLSMTITVTTTIKRFCFSSRLPSHIHFLESPGVCTNERKVYWTSLHSGRSPHDGGLRFFTLALSRKSHGLCDYCKADAGTISVAVGVVVTSSCSSSDHHHHYDLHVRPSYYHTIIQSYNQTITPAYHQIMTLCCCRCSCCW